MFTVVPVPNTPQRPESSLDLTCRITTPVGGVQFPRLGSSPHSFGFFSCKISPIVLGTPLTSLKVREEERLQTRELKVTLNTSLFINDRRRYTVYDVTRDPYVSTFPVWDGNLLKCQTTSLVYTLVVEGSVLSWFHLHRSNRDHPF